MMVFVSGIGGERDRREGEREGDREQAIRRPPQKGAAGTFPFPRPPHHTRPTTPHTHTHTDTHALLPPTPHTQEPKLGASPAAPGTAAPPSVRLGVCAMDKKARSKPVTEIMTRLAASGEFEIVHFGDDIIVNAPFSDWPLCDVLLSWHSDGFPLAKARAYASLRRPYLINDVHAQPRLLDRRAVYGTLAAAGIGVPTHIVINRDGLPLGTDPPGFVETEDWVELDGRRIEKPFVEKPADAENHNIYIYYPHSMGGGVKRLFRKVRRGGVLCVWLCEGLCGGE